MPAAPLNAEGLTVAVAACGRPEALARCLAALGAGTVLPGEVLVVDQAPSEEAERIVNDSGLPAPRYLRQPRLGLSASRNLALAAASGRVLAVTDDDCAPDPTWLAAVLGAFGRAPIPAAVGGAILALGPRPPGSYAVSLRDSDEVVDHTGRVAPWRVGSGANFAAPTAVLRELGGWDERLGAGAPGRAAEDSELLYRFLRAGLVVRYDPSAVIRHEWQSRSRRLATRWSYGYGIGVFLGLRLRRRDPFVIGMFSDYARPHVRALAGAALRRDGAPVPQHWRALASLGPGLWRGLHAGPRPPIKTIIGAS